MNEALERIWRRVLLAVGCGRVTLVNDAGPVQIIQARLNQIAVQDDIPHLGEYGFNSVPPVGSDAVLVFMAGNTSDGAVIATGHQTYRLRGLATGEVAISDDKGQKVYLSAAGIVIDAGPRPVVINAGGGLTINGDTTFAGTVTANGHRIDETHRHGDVQTGSGNTGVVT